jgi:hypothetical protein
LDLKGDLDRAIADNNEAIRLKPEYAPAYLARGGSRARTEEIERIMTGGAERPFVRIWHCCRPSAPSITSLSSAGGFSASGPTVMPLRDPLTQS